MNSRIGTSITTKTVWYFWKCCCNRSLHFMNHQLVLMLSNFT